MVSIKLLADRLVRASASLTTALLTGCSVEYPVDSLSCESYGDTIWDRCWWFNNSWLFGFVISGAFYAWGWKLIYERSANRDSSDSLLGAIYLFLGTAIILFGGGIAVSILFENLLRNN